MDSSITFIYLINSIITNSILINIILIYIILESTFEYSLFRLNTFDKNYIMSSTKQKLGFKAWSHILYIINFNCAIQLCICNDGLKT